MLRGIHRTPVQAVDIIRHVGTELSQLQIFVPVHFGLIN